MKYTLNLFMLVLLMACASDEKQTNTDFTEQNEKEILAYIAANNLDAEMSNSGLYYVVNETGTGAKPTTTDNVTVAYKGYLTNGNVFDQNDSGYQTNLQNVIKGWTEGITYFREGGNGILLIPSHLGYGSNGSGPIPGGSVLIFEVTLISVN